MLRIQTRIWSIACVVALGGCCCPSGGGGTSTTTTEAPATPPSPTPPAGAGITVDSVTFGTGLAPDGSLQGATATFAPTDTTIHSSIRIDGRPRSGTVTLRFIGQWQEAPIATASVDLSQTNAGVLFSFGEDTIVTGRMFTRGGAPQYIANYRMEILYEGRPVGSYPFRVGPPAGAIASRVINAVMAKGVNAEGPVEPGATFATTDTPHLVGTGDFGQHSWLEVRWRQNGVVLPSGSGEFRFRENASARAFHFRFVPQGGWQPGQYEAVLLLDGPEIGRYPFTVVAAAAGAAAPP